MNADGDALAVRLYLGDRTCHTMIRCPPGPERGHGQLRRPLAPKASFAGSNVLKT